MKRPIFAIGIALGMLMAIGCTDEDKHLLKDGYRVQGDLDPEFQVPVSSGEMTLDDLLTKFGGAMEGYITNDSIITFHYGLSMKDTVNVGGLISSPAPRHQSKKKPLPTKDGESLVSKDTIISYTVPIDIFNQVDLLQQNDISIGHLWISLDALVQGFCPDNVRDDVRQYVWASIDSLAIQYHGKNGHEDFGVVPQASLMVTDLTADNHLSFDSVNLASIINALPDSITAMFRLHLNVDEGLATKYMTDFTQIAYFQELLDSLRMTSLIYGADINIDLPFEIHVGHLAYAYDMQLNQNSGEGGGQSPLSVIKDAVKNILGEGNFSVDSSAITVILRIDNGIPLNIALDGELLDDNELPIFQLFDDTIASAITTPVQGIDNVSEATAPKRSYIERKLNLEEADKFFEASTLRLGMIMTTDGVDAKRIRRSDNLRLRMWVKVSPTLSIDMPLPGLENGIL